MDRITAAEVFIAIVERGSMIAAAEDLDMSRAMVTRYLAQMERWVGLRLLHRSTRKLSLTDAGEQTLKRCRKMLLAVEEIDRVKKEGNNELSGLLRISCSQSLAQSALVIAVTEYLKRHPQVTVDLQINNRLVNLVEERIDLALRITNELDPNLIARKFSHCSSVVCASPDYLKKYGTPRKPEDLAVHNCLTYSYFGKSLWHFERGGVKSSVAVSGNLNANENMVLMAATVNGAGISIQPYYSAQPLITSGNLVVLLPAYRKQELGIYGIYMSRKQMPATLRTMLDFLVEWFSSNQQWQSWLR